MNWKTLSLLPLLLLSEASGGVVATFRGNAPNVYGVSGTPTNEPFDVNADGIGDFYFTGGGFVTTFKANGSNRFIGMLSTLPDLGGNVDPVYRGDILGADTSSLIGSWHRHTDNRGMSGFSLGDGRRPLQAENAYIGVEFMAADGIHYGWIQYQGYSHPDTLFDTAIGLFHPPAGALGGLVNSWAYETEPGKPIIVGAVPEPSYSILFVMGLSTLLTKRRRQGRQ
jgi:hypothetical protein